MATYYAMVIIGYTFVIFTLGAVFGRKWARKAADLALAEEARLKNSAEKYLKGKP